MTATAVGAPMNGSGWETYWRGACPLNGCTWIGPARGSPLEAEMDEEWHLEAHADGTYPPAPGAAGGRP